MYIKKFKFFESVDSDDFYTQMTEEEVWQKFHSGDLQPFTEEDLDYIKKFLPEGYAVGGEPTIIWISYKDRIYRRARNITHKCCSIVKLSDDWFIAQPYLKAYKCDRLDGLEKCFKEKCI